MSDFIIEAMVLPRNRLHAERIGADALRGILETWLFMRLSQDLPKLLKTMATWCRRMPPADEFMEYLDLGRLVVQSPDSAIDGDHSIGATRCNHEVKQ